MSQNRNEGQFIGPGFGTNVKPGGLLDGLKFDDIKVDRDTDPLKVIYNYFKAAQLQLTIEAIYEDEFKCVFKEFVRTFDIRD